MLLLLLCYGRPAVCNFPKGDLYSHESILEQKLRQKGVLNDDEYNSQDLDWFLICTLAKKVAFFSRDHYIYKGEMGITLGQNLLLSSLSIKHIE